MKLSILKSQISITRNSRKFDIWFSSHCPLCGKTAKAPALGSERSARLMILKRVLGHIREDHANGIEDDLISITAVKHA